MIMEADKSIICTIGKLAGDVEVLILKHELKGSLLVEFPIPPERVFFSSPSTD